ncbi:MAG TPA: lantibiotic dehydratase [Kofleriaceae bacterium]|nr:lantibiotic dehydratase [Kofleriaceae bacterium]
MNDGVELGGGWQLWRWARLRGAGFAASDVLRLAAPEAARAADALIDTQLLVEQRRGEVLRKLRHLQREHGGDHRTRIGRALKRVRSRRPLEALPWLAGDALAPEVEALAQLEAALDNATMAFEDACDDAARDAGVTARDVLGDPRFREAMIWQNRHALAQGGMSLLRHVGEETARTRKQERVVASYLQRYCTKNDTIGFFGPIGWTTFDRELGGISMRPGAQLLSSRTVYFEYWCIDALAARIAKAPELKPQLSPRRDPMTWLDGTTLHHPVDRTTELPREYAELLRRCDGERSAAEIARLAIEDPSLGFDDPDEVYELLSELEQGGLVTWTIEIPTATAHPDRYLRALLERAGAPGRPGLEMLDELEHARARVAAAAGDPVALDRALAGIEETFVRLTGVAATREGGRTYAARTLVYEDCRRDMDLVLGTRFQREIGPPLALVMASARWYTHEIAARYTDALRVIFDEERDATGSATVDYLRFWRRARDLFSGTGGIVDDVAGELHARWDRILGVSAASGVRRIELSSHELQAAVAEAFAAPHPGWPSARHHSPDVLICAPSVEAIEQGRYLLVLGEVHVGMNTAAVQVALEQHPDPARLIAAREADLPLPGIAPVWSKARTRADFYSPSRRDFDLETGETRSARPRDHVIAVGSLVIEDRGGTLIVRSRDDGPSFELIRLLEQHLIAESFSRFDLLGHRPHTPRVIVDRVVFARERWRFACDQLPFVHERHSDARFLAVRTWARSLGLPRFVFVKTDREVKPMFVDLDSPILVDILVGDLAQAREAAITEMLPSIEDCWLADAAGNRYTSELRMIATDPTSWTRVGGGT